MAQKPSRRVWFRSAGLVRFWPGGLAGHRSVVGRSKETFGTVVVVDAGLAGVKVGRRDPFDVVAFVDPSCPTAGTDHAVIGSAR